MVKASARRQRTNRNYGGTLESLGQSESLHATLTFDWIDIERPQLRGAMFIRWNVVHDCIANFAYLAPAATNRPLRTSRKTTATYRNYHDSTIATSVDFLSTCIIDVTKHQNGRRRGSVESVSVIVGKRWPDRLYRLQGDFEGTRLHESQTCKGRDAPWDNGATFRPANTHLDFNRYLKCYTSIGSKWRLLSTCKVSSRSAYWSLRTSRKTVPSAA